MEPYTFSPLAMVQQPQQQMPGVDMKTMQMVRALMAPSQGGQTPEDVIGKMFQGVDPLSPQADLLREQAMQRYRALSPIGGK